MTTLREAAQQALEALEYGQHTLKQISENQWESRGQLAMQALRAALADLLESCPLTAGDAQQAVAAAELRRLHAQRDALLEALKELIVAADGVNAGPQTWLTRARAAITKAEEKV